jgi:hypothetical protein
VLSTNYLLLSEFKSDHFYHEQSFLIKKGLSNVLRNHLKTILPGGNLKDKKDKQKMEKTNMA